MNPTDIRQQYPEPQRREQKIALLRQHPPRLRQAGVHAPSRLRGSGEIIIRSHDPNPSAKDYDEGDRTLPRGILNTGDIELLQIYKELYADTLRTMPDGNLYVEYLDQRIAGLNRVKQQKEESRKKTERGELPVLPPVEESPDGTIKLTGVRQTEFQTATQGCWSVSLANILNSRGVQLSQKDIRAFRPAVSFESGNNLRAYETNEMNNDAGSDPYHDSELVMDNLPNTAVRHWGFENLPPAEIDEHGNVFRDHTDDTAVKAIREQVEYALKHDHSPIALKYCGHYQTIVGIKGNKLILKDSLPGSAYSDDRGVQHAPDPDASYEIDLYDIVRMTRSLPEDYFRDLSLMWLSELHKDPETGKVEELKDYPDLKVDEDGKLSLTRAENKNMLTVVGMADTECGGSAPQEKAGLRPFYKTKFPNVIHENLLKNSTEPSKTINEHLTIPNAALSPETRNHKVIGKLPGYETAIDPSLFTSEDDDLNRAILASLETAKQEQLRIQKNIGQRQANKMGAPVSTTGSISNTAEAKDLSADDLQGTGDSPTQDGQEQRGMDLLNDAQFEYIRNPEELNELAEIFRTKKSVRIVNWNSSEYNDAKSALDDFMTEHQKISEYIRTHYGKPGFNKGVEQQIANLNEKEEKLRNHLIAYVRKVTKGGKTAAGNKSVTDMTQAAGSARLAGARGLLDCIGGDENGSVIRLAGKRNDVNQNSAQTTGSDGRQFTAQEMEIIRREAKLMEKERPRQGYDKPARLSDAQKVELLNRNYDRQKSERVKDTSFDALYSQKYQQLKKDGEKNAHRRAAVYAQDELKKQQKEMK